jgi:tRNA nucleotidyltransferase/poly(A) polymerase
MLGTVADILKRRRSEGWLVGGGVRDRELGRYSPDLDVAVADDAAAVAREVAEALRAPWFALSERHPTYRVLGPEGYVDVAAVRGGGILADLAQRDFTVNAMAISLAGRELLDPFGGFAHLREGRLVAVSERIFADDPLRLMRAPRFCHTLGLRLDDGLTRSLREQAPGLAGAAAERVVTEMSLTLAEGRAAKAVRLWHDLALLDMVLPEVSAADGLSATLALLERLDDLLERLSDWFPATAGLLSERLAEPIDGALDRPVALRLAGLMHGLAVEEAQTAGRRLRLSGAMVSLLGAVSRHFSVGLGRGGKDGKAGKTAQAAPFADLLPEQTPVTRAAVLFLWNAAPWEPDVIVLAAAAADGVLAAGAAGGGVGAPGPAGRGTTPPDSSGLDPARLDAARRMMSLYAERESDGMPGLPLDGETLMRELGLESGPLVGKALREARLGIISCLFGLSPCGTCHWRHLEGRHTSQLR